MCTCLVGSPYRWVTDTVMYFFLYRPNMFISAERGKSRRWLSLNKQIWFPTSHSLINGCQGFKFYL